MALDPLSIGMKAVPPAVKALHRALGPTELGRMFKLLDAGVRRSAAIAQGKHDAVRKRVAGLKVDPGFWRVRARPV